MKKFTYKDAPVKVYGLPLYEKNGILERLPEDVREKIPNLAFLGRRCTGARLGFRTNSTHLKVTVEFDTLSFDIGMPIYSCQSAIIVRGNRPHQNYVGRICPRDYETKIAEGEVLLSGEMQDITIWFPRNEVIKDFYVEIDDDAEIEAPTPYKYGPILFYGSSITEVGHADKPNHGYTSLLSDWLDADHINLGFSGSAHGEPAMAEFIADIPMSVFVFDYDHNSSVEELEANHEPFFKTVREKNPQLPVVMLNRPIFEKEGDYAKRFEIVKRTYDNAVANGDKNVYFVNSKTFIPDDVKAICTTDDTHPNNFGFYFMAKALYPVLKDILSSLEK